MCRRSDSCRGHHFSEFSILKSVGKSGKYLAHYEDVNYCGYEDLVIQIEDVEGVFAEGDTSATLTGNLIDGTPIQGTEDICIVPKKRSLKKMLAMRRGLPL